MCSGCGHYFSSTIFFPLTLTFDFHLMFKLDTCSFQNVWRKIHILRYMYSWLFRNMSEISSQKFHPGNFSYWNTIIHFMPATPEVHRMPGAEFFLSSYLIFPCLDRYNFLVWVYIHSYGFSYAAFVAHSFSFSSLFLLLLNWVIKTTTILWRAKKLKTTSPSTSLSLAHMSDGLNCTQFWWRFPFNWP